MRITNKERAVIDGVLNGNRNPNTEYNSKVLSRPHVAITLEAILDQAGLSDNKLTKKMRQIINRKPERQKTKFGDTISNQTTVDSNTMNAIRTIWQVKGKFTEKHEIGVSGGLKHLKDEQLDKMIAQGSRFIKLNKHTLD